MAIRRICALLFATLFQVGALAATPTSPAAPSRIRISIKNEYVATLDFGALGHGSRDGTDTAEGVLELRGGKYVGTVTAKVVSTQALAGPVGSCGPGRYENSQELQVTGHAESGFNPDVQTVNLSQATGTGRVSGEYLRLEFAPVPGTELQPPNPNPDQDQVIACHTIIETESGRFLPLNDSRWTMAGGGYIIALPSTGVLDYTDSQTVAGPGQGLPAMPFDVKKSIWTIRVERLR
jgi:hypothetical protein